MKAATPSPAPSVSGEAEGMTIHVRANDPVARELLRRSIKWIERLDERRASIPHFFDNDTDPTPLAKDIRRYLTAAPSNPLGTKDGALETLIRTWERRVNEARDRAQQWNSHSVYREWNESEAELWAKAIRELNQLLSQAAATVEAEKGEK